MNILLLVAGNNQPSNSEMLAEAFVRGIRSIEVAGRQYGIAGQKTRSLRGDNDDNTQSTSSDVRLNESDQRSDEMNITTIYLRNLPFDHFSLTHYKDDTDQGEDFYKIQKAMQACDGFVIATPIWNFGVPAHLKNLIDRIGTFTLDSTHSCGTLGGKPFFCIFTGGAPLPAWKGLMSKTTSFIPQALQYFGASYIGHHFEGKCTPRRGVFGLVVDKRPESLKIVEEKGVQFSQVVAEFVRTGKAPIKQRLMGRIMKVGERVMKKVF